MVSLYYGEWLVECEFVCELLVLSCTIVHAETDDVALFRITQCLKVLSLNQVQIFW